MYGLNDPVKPVVKNSNNYDTGIKETESKLIYDIDFDYYGDDSYHYYTEDKEKYFDDFVNNMKENLRLICPNCDSQLGTFKSKNKNSSRKERYLKNYKN